MLSDLPNGKLERRIQKLMKVNIKSGFFLVFPLEFSSRDWEGDRRLHQTSSHPPLGGPSLSNFILSFEKLAGSGRKSRRLAGRSRRYLSLTQDK